MQVKKIIISACTIMIVTALAGSIWLLAGSKQSVTSSGNDQKAKKLPMVIVKPARKLKIANIIQLTGTIEPTKIAIMASPAEGPVVQCFVREGDTVTKGQSLVTVGRKHAAVATVTAMRGELNKQQEDLERIRQLVKSGAIPGEQLDIAKAKIEQARANLATAKTQVSDYYIVSPWDGIVAKVWISEGNYVAPRARLVEIFSPQSLVLRFTVPEKISGQMKKGLPLSITIDAYPKQRFQGTIVRVYPELDRETRTRTTEAEIASAPNLVPGMFARISLTTAMVKEAIVVPESAVLVNSKGESIIFVIKENKAEKRKVTTGIEEKDLIQIIEGVQAGEQVVVAGNETLKNGVRVRLKKPVLNTPKPAPKAAGK